MNVLGVDVGGTFTDFYFVRDGRIEVHKRPSTPDNPSRAILEGIRELGWAPDQVVHGSTVATNTVLERKGARVAFVTTAGFEDILEIGRQARPKVYELEPSRLRPLVPRELCFGVVERLDYEGRELTALAEDEVSRLMAGLSEMAPDSVAICLLFAYRNPDHEKRLHDALSSAGFEVSRSSLVAPEPREYERASTTVLSAYVGPKMRRYLDELSAGLKASGCDDLAIVQSNGGVLPADQAGRLAANTLLSGPAAGVAGAFKLAQSLGFDKAITFDMGGTSTDICLCDGSIPFTSEWTISDVPVRLPAVDVHTVGSGGGSVARLDEGGALRVGPESAGAVPGPAAYGMGGPATTTDAHLVLGRLSAGSLLGGGFPVDIEAAQVALAGLGLASAVEAAQGVIDVANAVMARAMRLVSIERGHDPAEFTLVAFGGAGPLHACELADALGIPRVVIPTHPGLMSAIGMTEADTTRDYAMAILETQASGQETERLTALLHDASRMLAARAAGDLDAVFDTAVSVDMRYEGQGHDLSVAWDGGDSGDLLQAFHELHERRYGHSDYNRTIELVTLRLRAIVARERVPALTLATGGRDALAARTGLRGVYLDGGAKEVPVYDRSRLLAGNLITGPAIVEQIDSTTFVAMGWQAVVDPSAALVLTRRSHGS